MTTKSHAGFAARHAKAGDMVKALVVRPPNMPLIGEQNAVFLSATEELRSMKLLSFNQHAVVVLDADGETRVALRLEQIVEHVQLSD